MPRTPRPLSVRPFRRGGWWHLDIRQNGVRWKEATNCQRRSDADEVAERRRIELGAKADLPAHPEAYALTTAVADFQGAIDAGKLTDVSVPTAKMFRSKVGHAARLLGDKDLTALTLAEVNDYVDARRQDGAKDHTIAKELVSLRRLMAWCEKQGRVAPGWRAAFPVKFRTGYDPRDRWLEPEDYLKLLAELPEDPPDRRLWLQVGCFTGGRESELKRLDWRDVDFKRGFVTLRTAKVRRGQPRKPRHIPLADELRTVLEAARRLPDGTVRASGPVFSEPWRNPALMLTRNAQRAGIVKAPVYKLRKDGKQELGPDGKPILLERGETLNDNDMRRTFASWMLQQGATVKEVADLLGHGSTAMVERVYGHLAKKNLVAAVGRLPRFTVPFLFPQRSGDPANPANPAGGSEEKR